MLEPEHAVPHARPETPLHLTHTHDEDCSDEDSDSAKQGNIVRSGGKKASITVNN